MLDQSDHLLLGHANRALATSLGKEADETSRRWAVVIAFYAAHHYVHALFVRHGDRLPNMQLRSGTMLVSRIHPQNHGLGLGGTRGSLRALSRQINSLDPLNMLFNDLREESNSARYGRSGGSRLVAVSANDVSNAIERLGKVWSLIESQFS